MKPLNRKKAEPLSDSDLESELTRMERLAEDALDADFEPSAKNWQEIHIRVRQDLGVAVATARRLLRERDEARGQMRRKGS